MRLDSTQKKALTQAVENVNGEIYLYGSRTDDNKKYQWTAPKFIRDSIE